jgi:hypothetical protein
LPPVEEQRRLKEAFLKAAATVEGDDDDVCNFETRKTKIIKEIK